MCALVPAVAPPPYVLRPLALPFPGPLVVSCPRVVLPPVPCPCGRLPATLGLSSPLAAGPPFALSLPGIVVVGWGGGLWGADGPCLGVGGLEPPAEGFGGVGGRSPWIASRRRASHAACSMAASGAASLGFAGMRVRISSKVCTMCTPSRLPASPAHFTQRRSSRRVGADHQVRWAGAWRGVGL